MAKKAFPSPLPGVFYRAPASGKPPFKSDGDAVAAGETVGLIEVMKTFTPVRAEEAGSKLRCPNSVASTSDNTRRTSGAKRRASSLGCIAPPARTKIGSCSSSRSLDSA